MPTPNNPYQKSITSKDGNLYFGHLDESTVKSSVLLTSGKTYSAADQYMQFPASGRMKGGIVNRCPGTYQIKCGDKPVDGIGFVLHTVGGDLVIAAPSGTVHIIGQSVNIHATGNNGNVNITSANDVNIDCVKANLKASAAINFVSSGTATLKCSNTMYFTAGFIRSSTNSAVTQLLSTNATSKLMAPIEVVQTIKRVLEFLS